MNPRKLKLTVSLGTLERVVTGAVLLFTMFFMVSCCSTVCNAQTETDGLSKRDQVAPQAKPNVLWLTAEDIGPHLGCYGDSVARTPHLDALAAKGMTYKRAWSNYPVCAPARTTIITGLYASSMAAGHMRSEVTLDSDLRMFPEYLRDVGYYCTNRSKEDYNTKKRGRVWDQSNKTAHYDKRTETSDAFFAVINQSCTHESKLRTKTKQMTTDPATIELAPYYPDTPAIRKDWARYYDNIAKMDDWVGQELQQLRESGHADNTIVVFFGDHGSGMPRHKRFAGDSGMRVPLIVFVPEKLQHLAPQDYQIGSQSDRLVGFVDLAPTMLSLAGIEPPKEMQGNAFMGPHQTESPEYVYGFRSRMDERIDCSRSISDGRYVYIRNYMPHLPHGQYLNYQAKTATTAVWSSMFRSGKLNQVQSAFWRPKHFEEMYDLKTDPHETQNLCLQTNDARTVAALERLRAASAAAVERFGDAELIPEPLTAKLTDISAYDARRTALFADVGTAANRATHPETTIQELFQMAMETEKPATVHWASVGLLLKGDQAIASNKGAIYDLLNSKVVTVRVNAAEVLAMHGDQEDIEKSLEVLLEITLAYETDYYAAVWALNAIDRLAGKADSLLPRLKELPKVPKSKQKRGQGYIERLIADLERER